MKTIAIILAIIAFSTAQNTSFYTNLVYIAQHQIGYDEAYECGQNVLLDYLQKAFEVNDTTHEQALQDATNMKPLETHLKVEVIEAKNLVWKDPNGKSDPFCTLYIESSPIQRYNTAVKNKTLTPVWNDEFYLSTKDTENDVLCLEVWHYDPAETILEKIRKVGDVYGVRGFFILSKEITMTCTSGNTNKKFIGCSRIALKNIPVTGSSMWYTLEKPTKTEDRGSIRLKLTFNAASNTQATVQEHRHLLNTLLLYELNSTRTNEYCWHGTLSPAAGTLIHQHQARKGLLPKNAALSEWIEYSNIHVEHPLHFVVFNKLADALHQPITDGLFSSDDVTLFWEAARKVLYSCFNSIKMIERLPTCIDNPTEQLTDILRIISSISSLEVPEDFNLFPAEMYNWLPKQNDTKIDVLKTLEFTVRENVAIWWNSLSRKNALEINTDQYAIEYCINIVQLALAELQKATVVFDSIFIEIINFPYAQTLYKLYGERLSDLCATKVQNVCQQLGYFDVDNNSKLVFISSEVTISDKLFELYQELKKFISYRRLLGMNDSAKLEIHNYYKWFSGGVLHWLDTWMQKANKTIERGIDMDNLDTTYDPSGSLESTSADTVWLVHEQMTAFWTLMAWPNIKESLIYLKIIVNHACQCAIYYADMIVTKVENVSQMSDQKNSTNVRNGMVNHLRASCFAISNIDYVKISIRLWAKDANLRKLVDGPRKNETEQRIDSFRKMVKSTVSSTIDSLENKIAELFDNIGNKMVPIMNGCLMDGADNLFDMNSCILHKLMDYLNFNTEILVKHLNEDNYQRIIFVIWEKLLRTLSHLVDSNLDKRRPRLFYSNLDDVLRTLAEFFSNSNKDAANVDMLEKIRNILQFYSMRTADLIRLYYVGRIQEQNDLSEPMDGVLAVRSRFVKDSLIVEVLNARNLRSTDSDDKTKRFVKLRILPKEKFNNIGKLKTDVHKHTLYPLFDETFNITLTTAQRNLKDAILVFEVMKKNKLMANTFMAEAFLPFSEIYVGGSRHDAKSLKQILLNLSRPGRRTSRIVDVLKHRKNDTEAKEFFAKLSNKIP